MATLSPQTIIGANVRIFYTDSSLNVTPSLNGVVALNVSHKPMIIAIYGNIVLRRYSGRDAMTSFPFLKLLNVTTLVWVFAWRSILTQLLSERFFKINETVVHHEPRTWDVLHLSRCPHTAL